MTDPFILAWIAEGETPTETDLEAADWKHPARGPLSSLDDVVAYLTETTWSEGFKPWVRTPDGDILDPDELIGYLPE